MKNFLTINLLLVMLALQSPAHARAKLYYYDGDVPMIEMMLNMMVVMGLIDKVPPQVLRNGSLGSNYGQHGNNARFNRNPWMRGPMQNWGGAGLPGKTNQYNANNNTLCGNRPCARPAALDGVWISSSNDMLGIKGHQIVWSKGGSNYSTGNFTASAGKMLVRFNDLATGIEYRYLLEGNQLKLKDRYGVLRRFHRLPGSDFY